MLESGSPAAESSPEAQSMAGWILPPPPVPSVTQPNHEVKGKGRERDMFPPPVPFSVSAIISVNQHPQLFQVVQGLVLLPELQVTILKVPLWL